MKTDDPLERDLTCTAPETCGVCHECQKPQPCAEHATRAPQTVLTVSMPADAARRIMARVASGELTELAVTLTIGIPMRGEGPAVIAPIDNEKEANKK